ncbi:uncharacterized protein N7458_012806 [Penicillium daleae]|uniref:Gfo/Idh/MocA-like oxidoreductase N-terminal domain-containing protein n=1 Tax=Penicillium daleae TaxID=63821 RepID=A0AAD6FYN3_9EURO|nr:uncharacterized protein N7458_012806 [Penicillium daleae]KAJ5433650.1 hypothetical protein N7458_012806 [Penicillium daleae]
MISVTPETKPNILIIGTGPHAQKTYVPHLQLLEARHGPMIRVLVDIEEKRDAVTEWAAKVCPGVHLHFVPMFTDLMPSRARARAELDKIEARFNINGIIIATEPLSHKSYALWGLDHGYHIMMDKPITTRVDAGTNASEAKGIADDYHEILAAYKKLQIRQTTGFVVSSHRRFNPLTQRAHHYIREIVERTGCPVTSVSASYCDGTFRLPIEMIQQDYHTYKQGYGKVSHSGYNIIDMLCDFAKAGLVQSKRPDEVAVISSFILPRGFFKMMTQTDYQKIFGAASIQKPRFGGYGELDATAQLTFLKERDPVILAQISMSSNGYGLQSSLILSKDQYKGSGRVKHESYEIKRALSARRLQIGANNHFEMKVFRNFELTGHSRALEVLHLADLADAQGYDHTKLYTEQAKEKMIIEFVQSIQSKLLPAELTSNIDDHRLPVQIMSAMYLSHINHQNSNGRPVVKVRGV